MQNAYIVTYDICDPKRLQKICKVMKGYGEHIQYSVFFCSLRDIDRVRLIADISEIINHQEDQVILANLGPDQVRAKKSLNIIGQTLPNLNRKIIIL